MRPLPNRIKKSLFLKTLGFTLLRENSKSFKRKEISLLTSQHCWGIGLGQSCLDAHHALDTVKASPAFSVSKRKLAKHWMFTQVINKHTDLWLRNHSIMSVTQRRIFQTQLLFTITLHEKLLHTSSCPSVMKVPTFGRVGNVAWMEHQAQNFGLVKAGKKSKSSERKTFFFVKFFFLLFQPPKMKLEL